MKKININKLNSKVAEQNGYISECNEKYEKKLRRAAERIADEHRERPIILLAGPSGSGKTTTALKIDNMLDDMGIHTHTISMDDYFLPKGFFEHIVNEDGSPDYESPMRIDINKLNEHMEKISRCEEVMIPKFNFAEQSSSDGFLFKRGKDDIIVFEGIHALNPLVTGGAGDFARCMYVSVRTRIELSDGTLVHPSMIRLMRRLIRDERSRGRGPAETFDMFKSVSRGEERFILPFKYRAEEEKEFSLDTYIGYEPAAYKGLLLDKMREVSTTYKDFDKYKSILSLLEEVDPIDTELIGNDSLVREFLGGSIYTD
ncbi:MAG: nucleoside kinase [Ruminococcus sp.]|uniref:Uridine kinase n=1 Tax=Ruminococcus albus SY3 TaxID=1341156 RepID=A0A011UJJ0_RUMAL|nr:nucleoside kinase [Ruminococcus albus]EXM40829.1 uridine kinase [Ruminococcus albus SY3]MBP5268210.1 nucleoside kinase [Ruminococcus sp.]